jgi:hypothetical protein
MSLQNLQAKQEQDLEHSTASFAVSALCFMRMSIILRSRTALRMRSRALLIIVISESAGYKQEQHSPLAISVPAFVHAHYTALAHAQ